MAYAIWDEESSSGYLHIGEAEKLIVVKAPSLDASTVLTLKTWGIPKSYWPSVHIGMLKKLSFIGNEGWQKYHLSRCSSQQTAKVL